AEEIAYIHDAKNDEQRQRLFDRVSAGEVRVLIGSTEKMGVGMNVQRKLIALHHLDAPYRPTDIEQREGRILRQGNENEEVEIYIYVTERSFDTRMWDMLRTKAAFINQAMSGQITTREAEDVGEMVLTAAEVSAIASGNPLIREHVEVTNEVRRLEALEAAYRNNQIHMQAQVSALEASIPNLRRQIAALEKDIRRRKDTKGDKFAMVVNGKSYTEREDAGKALQAASIAVM